MNELCSYYVAFLRCLYLIHQNHHWLAKGKNFYGNHLMFERIYKTAQEDADLAAEKFIGVFDEDVLNPQLQAQLISKIMEEYVSGDLVEVSLNAEKKFLELSEKLYQKLKDENSMTLGIDDMIMSIASNREAAVYLLKQTNLETKEASLKIKKRMEIFSTLK